MKEKYWEQFMLSGRIEDYLHYKDPEFCDWLKKVSDGHMNTGNRGKCSESDSGYGNGTFVSSCR